MLQMAAAAVPIDSVTLSEELSRHKELEAVGGVAYLASLTDGTPRRPSIAHYVRIVRDKALLRTLARGAELLQLNTCEPDADPPALIEQMADLVEQSRGQLIASTGIRTLADLPDIFSFSAEDVPELVEGLIPGGTVTLLTAPPGLGKSWFSLRLAICVALGVDFLGHECRRTAVLYLDKENPLGLIQQRFDVAAGGVVPGLHYWGPWVTDEPPVLGDARLLAIAETERPLIIFDSLVRFHAADENDASEMSIVMGHLRRLADAGATVFVIHHRGKTEANKYRGSSDILAGVDTAYSLEQVDGLLQLHRFKSRFAAESTVALRADLSTGTFEIADLPIAIERENGIALLRDYIDSHPGATQRSICGAVARWRLVSRQSTRAASKGNRELLANRTGSAAINQIFSSECASECS